MNKIGNAVFPKEVEEQLGFYVYRLVDPRNGETFYVGKGKGNRVFEHALGKIDKDADDILGEKLKRIHEIIEAGFDVQHIIHRHGMDEDTAFAVEAALIDAYPGITNIAGGRYSDDFGVAHSQQIIERYSAEEADLTAHKLLEITLNRKAEDNLLNSVRFCWRMNKTKAESVDYVLAAINGMIVDVFVADEWMDATPENFPEFSLEEPIEGRIGFKGRLADKEIRDFYRRKRLPEKKRGQANPFRYWNID